MDAKASLSQLAYEFIHRKLLDDALPAGTRISENQLARELGISRTPVREAIRRLRSEGVLYQVPRSGTFVARPDRKRILDAYEVRINLECLAVAKAVRNMTASEVTQLGQLSETMRKAARGFRDSGAKVISGDMLHQFASADMQFHLLLLRAADNRLLFKTVAEVLMQKRTITFRAREDDLHLVARVWLFHARIARAVRRRDAQQARYWMRQHLRDSRRNVLLAFDRQQAQRAAVPGAVQDLTGVVESLVSQLSQPGEPMTTRIDPAHADLPGESQSEISSNAIKKRQ